MGLAKCYNKYCGMRNMHQKGIIFKDTIDCKECGDRIFYEKSDEERLSEVNFEHIVFAFAILIMLTLYYYGN